MFAFFGCAVVTVELCQRLAKAQVQPHRLLETDTHIKCLRQLFARLGVVQSNSQQQPCFIRDLRPQRGTKAESPGAFLLPAEIKILDIQTSYLHALAVC